MPNWKDSTIFGKVKTGGSKGSSNKQNFFCFPPQGPSGAQELFSLLHAYQPLEATSASPWRRANHLSCFLALCFIALPKYYHILLWILHTHIFLCIIHGTSIPWPLLIIAMYNVHPYFSLKNLGKKCPLYMAKYGMFFYKLKAKRL